MASEAVSQSRAKVSNVLPAASLGSVTDRAIWDVIVVGGGIAGSTIAHLLASRGHSVLLVEKKTFPRYKVCGCCLNLRSLHYLKKLGIVGALDEYAAPELDGVALYAGGYHATLPLPGGRAISRSELDSLLVSAACAAGTVWSPGTVAALERPVSGTGRRVRLTQDDVTVTVQAHLVVAADGLGGTLFESGSGVPSAIAGSSRIGLGAMATEHDGTLSDGTIHMYCGRQGYVGVVAVEGGGIDLAASVPKDVVRKSGGPAACIAEIFDDAGQPPAVPLDGLAWRGTPPLTRRSKGVFAEKLVVMGDAAGYIEPFTGEGMAWAFESAFRLDAHIGEKSVGAWEEGVRSWARECNNGHLGSHVLCRCLSMGLRFPGLTTLAVRALSGVPALSQPIVSGLNRIARS